jgi:hypothetical protein
MTRMRKIPCLFKRDFGKSTKVYNEVTPGCEWVLAGEGVATRKFDGTCCLVRDGKLYKRYDAKRGKTPPEGFEPAQDPDPITGHWPGWLLVDSDKPEDRWHMQAWVLGGWNAEEEYPGEKESCNGTYELIGPKVQGDPEREYRIANRCEPCMHTLVRHGDYMVEAPRDFDGLRAWLEAHRYEGIVFWHPDGRMCKIRRGDYGLKWPMPQLAVSEAA